eukprot:Gb_31123 [translate_table: standard]
MGISIFKGLLKQISAELGSPLFSSLDIFFIKYCQWQVEGVWAATEVYLDGCMRTPLHCS